MDIPAAEVDIGEALITRLVGAQHPDLLADVRIIANGWDNVIARLGEHHVVRLPRRALAAPLVEHEARWLPELAPTLPVPVPAPIRVGAPTDEYPWTWLITPWLPGRRLDTVPVQRRRTVAADLGRAHGALHVPAPSDAPPNPVRGVPLAARAEAFAERVAGIERGDELAAVFADGLAAEPWAGPPLWLHGDPHPGNLLASDDDRLAAMIDFGDITAGDPATDLAIAWLAFDAEGRSAYFDAHPPVDAATRRRAHAWAAGLTAVFLVHSDDEPAMAAIGHHGLVEVLFGD